MRADDALPRMIQPGSMPIRSRISRGISTLPSAPNSTSITMDSSATVPAAGVSVTHCLRDQYSHRHMLRVVSLPFTPAPVARAVA